MTIAKVPASARERTRTVLTEIESKEFVKGSGIPVVETRLAKSKAEAAATAREMGFPVVLKIASTGIVHKSDIGGVKVGLRSQAQVRDAYAQIMAAAKNAYPAATIDGVSVQRMADPGVEVILGMSKDPQFGPLVMFGLGGVMVEVLKDVSLRLVPLSRLDARHMVKEIKGYPILQGYRGQAPVDIGALEDALMKLSRFVEAHPEVKELDLNPVFAYQKGIVAVDARVILEAEEA